VNLYCVVVSIGSRSVTTKGDWTVSLSVVDDSLVATDENVRVVCLNIFEKDVNRLPDVRLCGDAIRIHRARVQVWNENMQLLGARGVGTSYLVYRPRAIESQSTMEVSSPSRKCSVNSDEDTKLSQIWQWGQKRILSKPTINPEHVLTLSELRDQALSPEEAQSRDITAMVTSIFEMGTSQLQSPPAGYMRIWDGTGTRPYDPCLVNAVASKLEREGDPPPSAISRLSKLVKKLKESHPDLVDVEAVTGRIVNVAIWERSALEKAQDCLAPGSFVRLRNIKLDTCPVRNDGFCLHAHSKSYVTPLPDLSYEVIRLIQGEF